TRGTENDTTGPRHGPPDPGRGHLSIASPTENRRRTPEGSPRFMLWSNEYTLPANQEGSMADTYIQVYVQAVFAVQGRQSLISPLHKDEIFTYIDGTLREKGQKLMAVGGMPDHVHILFGMSGTIALSDLIKEIKASSSRLINDKKWLRGQFNWQAGFGAFSYSRSQVSRVANYIENQERHHAKRSFRDEYTALLKKFEVEYDPKYLFDFVEDARGRS